MTDLETEMKNLEKQLRDLAERVRLDAVATEFLEQKVEYRDGDYVLCSSIPEAFRVFIDGTTAKYNDGRGYVRNVKLDEDERFYTRSEVAEIVARATKENEIAALVEHNLKMDRALKDIANSTNPEYTIRRAREALGL